MTNLNYSSLLIAFLLCIWNSIAVNASENRSLKLEQYDSYGVIFSNEKAYHILNQCSRMTPKMVKSYWVPSKEEVAKLEEKFDDFFYDSFKMEKRHSNKMKDFMRVYLPNYYRQYAGIIVNSRKIIYVNFFHKKHLKNFPDVNWVEEPITPCYGGYLYFGVEYDLYQRKFYNLIFNEHFPKLFSQ